MAKFYGPVGYVETQETRPGINVEVATERNYSGDVFRSARKLASGESINDDVTVNNSLSIVADPYAYQHFFAIRYVKWMGAYWKVTNVEVQNPRLLLTIGGVYNGPTA
ncbi:MAG: hypothetical protein IJ523_07405 [Succinivibrionaceae bacterium]|nr:hypothetical protein [Succinivibrionaceae bacterium]